MSRRTATNLTSLLVALAVAVGCTTDVDVQPGEVSGVLIQEFPIVNGAVWAYQNVDTPSDQYRISVEGTRNISGVNHWKLVYTKLDANGTPLIGEPPDPIDFYSANGLHLRLGALTLSPGIFARAVFVLGTKAAAVGAFPVAAAYVRRSMADHLDALEPDDPLEQREPIRYDEFTADTLGLVHESASEAVNNGALNFQKHVPPRRLWQFPLNVGSRWIVFRTAKLSRGPTRDPQPVVVSERRVAAKVSVTTPGYSGDALLIEEWVVGLREDESGEPILPSIDDEDGDGTPDRGEPTAKYWVARNVGVVKYEYEFVELGPPPEFVRKTYHLTRHTIPDAPTVDHALDDAGD